MRVSAQMLQEVPDPLRDTGNQDLQDLRGEEMRGAAYLKAIVHSRGFCPQGPLALSGDTLIVPALGRDASGI